MKKEINNNFNITQIIVNWIYTAFYVHSIEPIYPVLLNNFKFIDIGKKN